MMQPSCILYLWCNPPSFCSYDATLLHFLRILQPTYILNSCNPTAFYTHESRCKTPPPSYRRHDSTLLHFVLMIQSTILNSPAYCTQDATPSFILYSWCNPPAFCTHDATHLHYGLIVQLTCILNSWCNPPGFGIHDAIPLHSKLMMHPTCILYWWCIPPASFTHDATNLHPELEIPIWVLLRLHKFILSYSIFTKQGKKLSWLRTSTNYLPQRGGEMWLNKDDFTFLSGNLK